MPLSSSTGMIPPAIKASGGSTSVSVQKQGSATGHKELY